ncbi:hypothetical protein Vadar_023550 [Vaccinium darrowii]|uniref:Uncharacterized protein n=1 Tax=Vaccinium darrowii TaxID=229202 RepID=A0ACB7Y2L5_9ERIC|nr:hypothetical protein Vadar_023550 [Vaccinium darrowii]
MAEGTRSQDVRRIEEVVNQLKTNYEIQSVALGKHVAALDRQSGAMEEIRNLVAALALKYDQLENQVCGWFVGGRVAVCKGMYGRGGCATAFIYFTVLWVAISRVFWLAMVFWMPGFYGGGVASHGAFVAAWVASQKGQIGITLISEWVLPYSNSKPNEEAAQRGLDFMFGWFIHPLTYGDYPQTMRSPVGKRLPKFTPEQVSLKWKWKWDVGNYKWEEGSMSGSRSKKGQHTPYDIVLDVDEVENDDLNSPIQSLDGDITEEFIGFVEDMDLERPELEL